MPSHSVEHLMRSSVKKLFFTSLLSLLTKYPKPCFQSLYLVFPKRCDENQPPFPVAGKILFFTEAVD